MQQYFRHLDLIDGQYIGKKPPGSQVPPPGWRPEAAASTASRSYATVTCSEKRFLSSESTMSLQWNYLTSKHSISKQCHILLLQTPEVCTHFHGTKIY
jgi:hypothetical protein